MSRGSYPQNPPAPGTAPISKGKLTAMPDLAFLNNPRPDGARLFLFQKWMREQANKHVLIEPYTLHGTVCYKWAVRYGAEPQAADRWVRDGAASYEEALQHGLNALLNSLL